MTKPPVAALSAAAVCSLLAAGRLFWPQPSVRIDLPDSGCYLDDSAFRLQWRHSVEHQLWREFYRSDGRRLYLERTEIQTFGAGVPSDGKPVPASEKGFSAFESGVVLNEMLWTVSANMQGEIRTPHHVWPVYRQIPDYTAVRITPTLVSRAVRLWKPCYELRPTP